MINPLEFTNFPAKDGDSFLIETSGPLNILVDGGYVNTYTSFIWPTLERIHTAKQPLHLAVVSHIDEDDIVGMNAFLKISVQSLFHLEMFGITLFDILIRLLTGR